MPKLKLTPRQRDGIVLMYKKTGSLSATAKKFGVTPGYVSQLKTGYKKVIKYRQEEWNPLKFEWRYYA